MIGKYVLPALAALGLAGAIVMVEEGNRTPPKVTPVVQPAAAPFPSYIFGPGIVEASTGNIAIGTPASGIVTAVYVKWGERVKRGVPLFKIDSRDLEAQLLPANAKVKEMQALLAPAAGKISEAAVNLEKAQNHLKTGNTLEPGVSISAEELANRRFDVSIATASLASAKGEEAQIQTQIASAQAQVGQIQREIEMRTIRAPLSGRILQMSARPGEYAESGVLSTPLMELGDDSRMNVRVDIDESDAWRLQPCARAAAAPRGNSEIKIPLRYVRTDPDVIPKTLLTGDSTQRTDSRVLQVIYSFDRGSLPLYVGQLMDVFIEAPPAGEPPGPDPKLSPCANPGTEGGQVGQRK